MIKDILGVLTIFIAFYAYIPYFRDIFAGRTKPHAFSWLVWCILTLIGFFAQLSDDAGAGSWATGFAALIAFIIFILAVKKGEKSFTISDWIFLIAALVSILPWAISKDALMSLILVILIDACGFAPTIRKAYFKPFEETLETYFLSSIKFAVSLIALNNYSLITMIYPMYLVLANGSFVLLLLMRRKKVKSHG